MRELAFVGAAGCGNPEPGPLAVVVCDEEFWRDVGEREGWSWTDSSFSIRSAKAFRVTSKGSKPKSSSGCLEEPKPNAACQSVEDDTGIVSVGDKMSDEFKIHSPLSHLISIHTSES